MQTKRRPDILSFLPYCPEFHCKGCAKTLSGEVLDECNNLVWELENLLEMEYKYGYEAGRTAGEVETAPGEVAAPNPFARWKRIVSGKGKA